MTLNEHYYTYASTLAEVYETFYNVICSMKMEGSLIKKCSKIVWKWNVSYIKMQKACK